MQRNARWLLAAALIGGGFNASFAQDRTATNSPKLPAETEKIVAGPACNGKNCATKPASNCAAPAKCEHPPLGSCLDRFGKWFFGRPSTLPCECKGHLPAYRPPLIAWFPCEPSYCGPQPCATYGRVITVQPRPDAPPPMPPKPQITLEDRQRLISGSSAAMAIKQPLPPPTKTLPPVQPVLKTAPPLQPVFKPVGANGVIPVDSQSTGSPWQRSSK